VGALCITPWESSWCLTGIGAKTQYFGYGRMLSGIAPAGITTGYIFDSDHEYPDSGTLTGQMIMIQFDDTGNY